MYRGRPWLAIGATALLCVFLLLGNGQVPDALGATGGNQNTILQWLMDSNAHLGSESQFIASVKQRLAEAEQQRLAVQQEVQQASDQLGEERERVIPILQFRYEHGPNLLMWAAIILSAKDWETMQSRISDLQEIISQRQRILQRYAEHTHELGRLLGQAQSVVEDLQVVRENLAAEEVVYRGSAQQAAAAGAATPMDELANLLNLTWNSAIAPQIGQILRQMDNALNRLPDALPPGTVHMSLDGGSVDIPQVTFNNLIHSTPSLRQVSFLFRPGALILTASSGSHRVLVIGHLVLEQGGQRADYVIDHVAVDGILVAPRTSGQWLQNDTFFIDVTRLSTHLHIQSIEMDNQSLHLQLKIAL